MKVMHVLDHSIPHHSGYAFRTCSILEWQRKLGIETAHITSCKHGNTSSDVETYDGLKFYRTQCSNIALSRLPVIHQVEIIRILANKLNNVIKKEKPDLIHAHSPSLNGIASLMSARQFNLPVVYEVRAFWEDAAVDHGTTRQGSMRYRMTRMLESYVLKRADAITTICNGLRNDILERGLDPKKITVIPNSVDIDKFNTNRNTCKEVSFLKNSLGLSDDQVILGFIGSFYSYEGLELLVKAGCMLIEKGINIRLVLVGDGPCYKLISDIARKSKYSESIIITGKVDHNRVGDFYELIDIFVYPRISMRLTNLVTPLKPLEAMAYGKTVLASDVGGHKELIENNVNGLLFESENTESLAKVLERVINDKELRQRLGEDAREYVVSKRTWEENVYRYFAVYESVLDIKKAVYEPDCD